MLRSHGREFFMKPRVLVFVLLVLACGHFNPVAYSQAKLAQTGLNFLSVGTDARAAGMGEAFTTIEGSSPPPLYNPAGIAGVTSIVDLSTNTAQWIADIKYLSGT